MMAKIDSRTISGRSRLLGLKDRDANFPRAPVCVTDDAQARSTDVKTLKKFEFGEHDREVLLPERPRTSAGPASQSSFGKFGTKRETRDDLYFNPLAAHGTGTTFYDFDPSARTPAPESKPLESSSPPATRNFSLAQRPVSPKMMATQQVNMVVPEMEIGMALGSPSHQPADWYQQPRAEVVQSPSTHTVEDSVASSVTPLVKQKKSKWGVLGGLFGGKRNVEPEEQPFYKLQTETAQQTTPIVTTSIEANKYEAFPQPPPSVPLPSAEEPPRGRSRGRSISTRKTKTKTPKSDMKRANTVPVRQDFQDNSDWATPTITLEGGPLTDHHHILAKANGSLGHKLDVDIPSIQMERYSVMFGSVLHKQPSTSSSLLARRQTTLDKLKVANEAFASKEKELREREKKLMIRRATSPQPTKSPAFSLFPSTPSKHSHGQPSPLKLRQGASGPLQRSNTSPAVLSPSRPTFAPGRDNKAHAMIVGTTFIVSETSSMAGHSPNVPRSGTGTMQQSTSSSQGKFSGKGKAIDNSWTPDDSHLILDSPDSGDDLDYTYIPSPLHDSQPLKPKLVEPAWEIINRQPEQRTATIPTVTTSRNHSNHSTSTSTSSSAASISTASTSISVPVVFTPSNPTNSLQVKPRLPPSSTSRIRRNDSTASATSLDEAEARLKTAADVSIARQISISRQQRQLLLSKNAMPIISSNIINPSVESVGSASRSGAVATAAKEERQRPMLLNRSKSSPLAERVHVVTARKANTPTLVVVPGPKDNEHIKTWNGNTTNSPIAHPGPPLQTGNLSIAERRGGKEMGTIKVGLSVRRKEGKRPADRAMVAVREGGNSQHRKSERVVVEMISVASN